MAEPRVTQARADLTRGRILAAARAIFSEAGPAGARIDAIAERAGCNKQRIYANFGSKEALFRCILGEAVEAITACEAELLDGIEAEPARMGGLLTAGYLRFHRENPHFWRLLAWANLGGEHTPAGVGSRGPVLERLQAAYAKAQTSGAMPAALSFQAWFIAITGTVHFLFANQRTATASMGMRLDDPATCDALVADVVASLGGPARRRID